MTATKLKFWQQLAEQLLREIATRDNQSDESGNTLRIKELEEHLASNREALGNKIRELQELEKNHSNQTDRALEELNNSWKVVLNQKRENHQKEVDTLLNRHKEEISKNQAEYKESVETLGKMIAQSGEIARAAKQLGAKLQEELGQYKKILSKHFDTEEIEQLDLEIEALWRGFNKFKEDNEKLRRELKAATAEQRRTDAKEIEEALNPRAATPPIVDKRTCISCSESFKPSEDAQFNCDQCLGIMEKAGKSHIAEDEQSLGKSRPAASGVKSRPSFRRQCKCGEHFETYNRDIVHCSMCLPAVFEDALELAVSRGIISPRVSCTTCVYARSCPYGCKVGIPCDHAYLGYQCAASVRECAPNISARLYKRK